MNINDYCDQFRQTIRHISVASADLIRVLDSFSPLNGSFFVFLFENEWFICRVSFFFIQSEVDGFPFEYAHIH